ncbi:C4-dicarboxylate TRAP transporter substrate-binding protein [Shimwellia blattae]|uniref:Putative TRAP dicarboxylate transporter n=1 Tax=Shimwellia blattae (strain ATCC 29907 / DSM 4481 / JCM 1650 / NBRC 105725 / CDC 9005-74) TaxID=630626 RepID=I2BDA0_SHIBC|nr:C4-dicarboxylate TRAP transporter substrate-binding protein [Shimwellia blattae]AFJ48504.1 putative TRAP dicarboxylate transporter [Shimwellia blattae DSM 4481 = NBRC 105725]GAB83098.1 putative transporter [Shimwellia blattae DSM 4481 = NBRC 105725]VDY65996.1 Neu5Ac-binding protein [Shimwellia blattae]VEC26577.1 Neu5Ac-binding protein [Shimwellia blattae]
MPSGILPCKPILLFALLVALPAAAANYSLNLSTSLSRDDPIYQGLEAFKAAVETRSEKKIRIKLFPAGQLGADNELLQHAQSGSNVGVVVDSARLASFVPELSILPAPFVFPDYAAQRKFVASDTFRGWEQRLAVASGLVPLSFNWYQGGRMLVTKKPVRSPADLNGVKVRALEAPVTIETIKCLGGEPVPLAWAEIYSSLQTGIVDAAEAQPTAVYGSKLYEISKHITQTRHIHLMTGIVVSQKWLQSLPQALRDILHDEAQKQGDIASQETLKKEQQLLAAMAESGVSVDTVDVAPFRQACATVPEKLGLQDALAQVQDVIARG